MSNTTNKWKPEFMDEYYCISVPDYIFVRREIWTGHPFDEYHFGTNNCFKTKIEAEFQRDIRNGFKPKLRLKRKEKDGETQ